jgi:hypothetical protein
MEQMGITGWVLHREIHRTALITGWDPRQKTPQMALTMGLVLRREIRLCIRHNLWFQARRHRQDNLSSQRNQECQTD